MQQNSCGAINIHATGWCVVAAYIGRSKPGTASTVTKRAAAEVLFLSFTFSFIVKMAANWNWMK